MRITVTIVIPTYSERENIVRLMEEIQRMLRRVSYEILVVDDLSPDNTSEAVARAACKDPRIRLLIHSSPRDLGKSILLGIQTARGRIIVGMDADGNHNPRHIPRLLEVLGNADLAVGSRFVPSNPTPVPERFAHGTGQANKQIRPISGTMQQWSNETMVEHFRYWGSFLFNAVLRVCFGFPIWDNTSGFYAIRRKTLRLLDPPSIYYGYGEYHLRLVYKAMRKGLNIVEVPIVYPPRIHGQSKSRLGRMLLTYLWTALQLKSQR